MQVLSFGYVSLGHSLLYYFSAEMMEMMIDKLWLSCKFLALANANIFLVIALITQLLGLISTILGGGRDE